MIAFFLKFLGGGLLVICGYGIGWTAAKQKRKAACSIASFERFLQYLTEAIRFRRLPGNAILAMAAQHAEFAVFCPQGTTSFSHIRPPDSLTAQYGAELLDGLHTLETAPQQIACDTLEHLCALCRQAGMQAQEATLHAQQLYPRMGVCFGLLAAIVLS